MNVIGGGSITSKGYKLTRTHEHATSAWGAWFWVGKTQYVDWAMGLHGSLDGHNPEWLHDAITEGAHHNAPSIPVFTEQKLADVLQVFYPHCDAVRFFADGSSPCEAAVRLARAATGRNAIAFQGYHGVGTSFPHNPDANDLHVDERRGIPQTMWQLTRQFEWGNVEMLERIKDVAAIMVEVPPVDDVATLFLQRCAEHARKIGALFVIDDVVTGFRVAPGGASERYNVQADMYCIGKALGSGVNISALVGKSELLDLFTRGVHYSSTFNGNGIATSAGLATLEWIITNREEIYPTLYARGERLKAGMNQVFDAAGLGVRMMGNPTRPILDGMGEEWIAAYRDGMWRRGFYVLAHPWYVTMAHDEKIIDATIAATREVLAQ